MRLVLLVAVQICSVLSHRQYHRALHSNSTGNAEPEFGSYSRFFPGRHVCAKQNVAEHPTKTRQTFYQPHYKKYVRKCSRGNQLCEGVRLVYETTYKDVVSTKATKLAQTHYVCCPGWMQIDNRSNGCNKPVCSEPCRNGGSCVQPNLCLCPKGFRGQTCEIDIDECKEHKPCDHICYNSPGSYNCQCKENFLLHSDGHSCLTEGDGNTAFEARDLEFHDINKRLQKLETTLKEKQQTEVTKKDISNIFKRLAVLSTEMNSINTRLKDVDSYKTDMMLFKNRFYHLEQRTNDIDNRLMRNDNGNNIRKCIFPNYCV